MHFTTHILGVERAIIEAGMAFMTTETFIMPFAAHRLNILSDDWLFALLALGSASFSALRLTIQAPGVAILLDMSLAFLEGIATFGTEKMSVMPVLAQCNSTLSNNRSFAVLAPRGKAFMPIEMTVEA
jgi:hypothetical protein